LKETIQWILFFVNHFHILSCFYFVAVGSAIHWYIQDRTFGKDFSGIWSVIVIMLWMEIPKYFYLKLMTLRVKLDELIIKIRLVLSEQVLFLNVIEDLTRVG
jgi:hypothetical protein